jgi:hypothetical protein
MDMNARVKASKNRDKAHRKIQAHAILTVVTIFSMGLVMREGCGKISKNASRVKDSQGHSDTRQPFLSWGAT